MGHSLPSFSLPDSHLHFSAQAYTSLFLPQGPVRTFSIHELCQAVRQFELPVIFHSLLTILSWKWMSLSFFFLQCLVVLSVKWRWWWQFNWDEALSTLAKCRLNISYVTVIVFITVITTDPFRNRQGNLNFSFWNSIEHKLERDKNGSEEKDLEVIAEVQWYKLGLEQNYRKREKLAGLKELWGALGKDGIWGVEESGWFFQQPL